MTLQIAVLFAKGYFNTFDKYTSDRIYLEVYCNSDCDTGTYITSLLKKNMLGYVAPTLLLSEQTMRHICYVSPTVLLLNKHMSKDTGLLLPRIPFPEGN